MMGRGQTDTWGIYVGESCAAIAFRDEGARERFFERGYETAGDVPLQERAAEAIPALIDEARRRRGIKGANVQIALDDGLVKYFSVPLRDAVEKKAHRAMFSWRMGKILPVNRSFAISALENNDATRSLTGLVVEQALVDSLCAAVEQAGSLVSVVDSSLGFLFNPERLGEGEAATAWLLLTDSSWALVVGTRAAGIELAKTGRWSGEVQDPAAMAEPLRLLNVLRSSHPELALEHLVVDRQASSLAGHDIGGWFPGMTVHDAEADNTPGMPDMAEPGSRHAHRIAALAARLRC